ncbi:MAG: Gfo/Idh/MocA family oxidoreductase [Planctomycetaceae bacterium]|nr:Gfo/Idh/MocA family oxidoreductase [Planctomycetaceae bacterium]
MVRIGIIGIGFMGYTHFSAAKDLKDAKVTAICTRDENKLAGDWTSIQGNFGPRGGQVDVSELKTYNDYKELLADPEIDLVDICLPPELHEKVTLEAIAAGKATIVEKPIAVQLDSANRMVEAADNAGVPFMVAQVLPFFPEFQFAADCVRSGRFGKLRAGHFRRVICEPDWSSDMSDYKNLGGWGIDLHIHDNHFISLICGLPDAVYARGTLQEGFVNHLHSQYIYDDSELAVSAVSGGIAAKGLQFAHGYELFFQEATVAFSAGTLGGEWIVDRPLTVFNQEGKLEHPTLDAGNEWYSAFTNELQAAVEGVKDGKAPRLLSGTLARDALKLCYAEAESIATGEIVSLA